MRREPRSRRPPGRRRAWLRGPRALCAILGVAALAAPTAVPANLQDEGFVPEVPLTARFGVGARSLGMGGTGVAAADDLSALHLNPAALALVRRTEVSLSMAHRRLTVDATIDGRTRSSDLSKLRLNALGVVYPFPTYRGALVVGGVISRPQLLDRDVRRTLPDDGGREFEFERGGPINWRGGLAVMVAPNFTLGGSFAYLTGDEDRTFSQVRGESAILVRDDARIRGWTGSLGALAMAGERVRFGATLHFPEHYDIEGTQRVSEQSSAGDTTFSIKFVDEVDLPFSIGLGAALTLPSLVLTADLRYTDWREIDFAGPLTVGDEDAYRATTGWKLGVEGYLPWAPVRLRAGYQADPLPYLLLPDFRRDPANTIRASIDEDRALWTAGAGGLVAGHVALDLAVLHGGFRRSTAAYAEDVGETRILVTVAYHD